MLSLAATGGSMADPASYQPVWLLMVAEQLVVVLLTCSLPKPRSEGAGYSKVGGGDEPDEKPSIYRRRADPKE
jgi:hypothetical protein